MAAQWVKEGLRVAADAVLKTDATPEVKNLVCFSDNETITDATVYADLTIISANGITPTALAKATWAAGTDADPVASIYNGAAGVEFTLSGDQDVYGWAIVGATSNALYIADNWGLKSMKNGDTLTVAPITVNWDIPE